MAPLSDIQKLAVAQALYSVVADAVATNGGKNRDNLRTKCAGDLRALYDDHGVDRQVIKIGGKSVGTFSARKSKGGSSIEPRMDNPDALAEWFITDPDGQSALRRFIRTNVAAAVKAATSEGEVPPGIYLEHVETESQWVGTLLKVNAQDVAEALGDELPSTVVGLLGGE